MTQSTSPADPPEPEAEASVEGKRKREAATRDLVATIKTLAEVAENALGEGSLAGWNAARAALADAGRLQMGLRPGGDAAAPVVVDDPPDDEADSLRLARPMAAKPPDRGDYTSND